MRDAGLRIATATGRGAGRFLAVALLDALDGGAHLAAVRVHQDGAAGWWSVDFSMSNQDSAGTEIVRASMSARGDITSSELLRTLRGPTQTYRSAPAFTAALRAGQSVERIEFTPAPTFEERALRMTLGHGVQFDVDLRDFAPSRPT